VLQNETIKEIARRHGETSAQIVLRWQIQDGYIAVPGSGNPQHIAENAAIFDFTLSDDDMQQMRTLTMSRRFENLVPCNPMTQIPC
jgi:diketogulonate reductase-like aldo/keto reductase